MVGQSCCKRGAIVENVASIFGLLADAALENAPLPPTAQDLLLHPREFDPASVARELHAPECSEPGSDCKPSTTVRDDPKSICYHRADHAGEPWTTSRAHTPSRRWPPRPRLPGRGVCRSCTTESPPIWDAESSSNPDRPSRSDGIARSLGRPTSETHASPASTRCSRSRRADASRWRTRAPETAHGSMKRGRRTNRSRLET